MQLSSTLLLQHSRRNDVHLIISVRVLKPYGPSEYTEHVTFVRAEILPTGPKLLSDWYVTDPASVGPAGYKDGILKALRLRHDTCIAYAGPIEECLNAVRLADASFAAGAFQHGLDSLATSSRAGHCEFVVARIEPTGLFEIKKGLARPSRTAWIGNHRAFERFQHHASVAREDGADGDSILHQAFHGVINDGVEGVGIMMIAVGAEPSGFEYAPSMSVVAGFTPQTIPSGVPTTVTWGGAHDGAFAVSVMGAVDDPAVGAYFPHGQFGLLSAPLLAQETAVVGGRTQSEFVSNVRTDHQIALVPAIELT